LAKNCRLRIAQFIVLGAAPLIMLAKLEMRACCQILQRLNRNAGPFSMYPGVQFPAQFPEICNSAGTMVVA
jgi:hypothetical protein